MTETVLQRSFMSLHAGDPLVTGPLVLAALCFGLGLLISIVAGWAQALGLVGEDLRIAGFQAPQFGAGLAFLAFPIAFAGPIALQSIATASISVGVILIVGVATPFLFAGLLHLAMSAGWIEHGDRSLLGDAFGASVIVVVLGVNCIVFWPPVETYVAPALPVASDHVRVVWISLFVGLALLLLSLIASRGTGVRKPTRVGVRELFDE